MVLMAKMVMMAITTAAATVTTAVTARCSMHNGLVGQLEPPPEQ